MDSNDISSRIEELESHSAFQDELYSQLNEIVARQDREIIELKRQLKNLSQRLKDLGDSSPGNESPADHTPPHY